MFNLPTLLLLFLLSLLWWLTFILDFMYIRQVIGTVLIQKQTVGGMFQITTVRSIETMSPSKENSAELQ